jgi:hypothetical protein
MKDEKHTAPGNSVAAAGDLLATKTENKLMELRSQLMEIRASSVKGRIPSPRISVIQC